MELKTYLKDTFSFNDWANRKLLEQIKLLPEPGPAIKFFSHLINCQYKWMARILQDPKAQEMDWWEPLYLLDALEEKWSDSLQRWLNFLDEHSDEELMAEINFIGFDGGIFAAKPGDIALQLNYHSIHHRAQIQTIIREQGFTPVFLDYIGTKYRKLS